MQGVKAELGLAAVAFVATNLDNCLVTTAMVAAAPHERAHRVAAGQVVGFALLVAASAATAVLLFEIPDAVVGLLGLVPLTIGTHGLIVLWRSRCSGKEAAGLTGRIDRRAVGRSLTAAVLVTVAAGGDNLAVYIPLFRSGGAGGALVVLAVFGVGEVAVTWLVLTGGRHPRSRAAMERLGAIAVPALLCCLGLVILVRAGTLSSL